MLTLHSLQTEVDVIAANPSMYISGLCGKIASAIEYWLGRSDSVRFRHQPQVTHNALS